MYFVVDLKLPDDRLREKKAQMMQHFFNQIYI